MPGTTAYKAQPGGIVVDESIAGTIGMMRAMRGMADDSIPAVVQVSPAQPAATALSGEWWNQPSLLPTSPQGTIASTGGDPSGNCRVTLNGAPLVSVAPGSIILPDTTRAFAILANCKAEPLITLPLGQNNNTGISISGGSGPRNPINIISGQSANHVQASFSQNSNLATAAMIVAGTGILLGPQLATAGVGTTLLTIGSMLNPVTLAGGIVIIGGSIAYTIWANKAGSGIDDTQLGAMAPARISRENQTSSPMGPQWEPPPDCPTPGNKPIIVSKIQNQMSRRGWTEADINRAFERPVKVAHAVNKQTWARATAYFVDTTHYVVIDSMTGTVLQISDRLDPNWKPDDTFENPRENVQNECNKTGFLRKGIFLESPRAFG